MIDPDKIYQHIMAAAKEWTEADEEARRLAKLERIVLAEIMNQYAADAVTMAERKSMALASPEFKLHVNNLVIARTKANVTKARYEAAKSLAELRRSQESTRRAEMGIR